MAYLVTRYASYMKSFTQKVDLVLCEKALVLIDEDVKSRAFNRMRKLYLEETYRFFKSWSYKVRNSPRFSPQVGELAVL